MPAMLGQKIQSEPHKNDTWKCKCEYNLGTQFSLLTTLEQRNQSIEVTNRNAEFWKRREGIRKSFPWFPMDKRKCRRKRSCLSVGILLERIKHRFKDPLIKRFEMCQRADRKPCSPGSFQERRVLRRFTEGKFLTRLFNEVGSRAGVKYKRRKNGWNLRPHCWRNYW